MLNWADLMSLVITLAGALGGVGGARGEKAGVLATILFGVGGLLVGLGGALLSTKFAYSALRSKGAGIFYMVVPMLFLFAVIASTAFLASWLTRHVL